MSVLNLVEDSSNNMYIKHSWALGRFVDGNDEPLDFEHFAIDLDFKTGFTKWEDMQKDVVWDSKPGIKPDNWKDLEANGYKRSFWCRVYLKDHGVFIWERNGRPELEVFDQMITDAWATKDANPGKVPVFKYVGSEKIKYKVASGYQARVEFSGWTERPAEFDQLPTEEPKSAEPDDSKEDGIPF